MSYPGAEIPAPPPTSTMDTQSTYQPISGHYNNKGSKGKLQISHCGTQAATFPSRLWHPFFSEILPSSAPISWKIISKPCEKAVCNLCPARIPLMSRHLFVVWFNIYTFMDQANKLYPIIHSTILYISWYTIYNWSTHTCTCIESQNPKVITVFWTYISSVESQKGTISIFKEFPWEPEGHYRCTKYMVIALFWFSMESPWIVTTPFWLSTDYFTYTFWTPSMEIWFIHLWISHSWYLLWIIIYLPSFTHFVLGCIMIHYHHRICTLLQKIRFIHVT